MAIGGKWVQDRRPFAQRGHSARWAPWECAWTKKGEWGWNSTTALRRDGAAGTRSEGLLNVCPHCALTGARQANELNIRVHTHVNVTDICGRRLAHARVPPRGQGPQGTAACNGVRQAPVQISENAAKRPAGDPKTPRARPVLTCGRPSFTEQFGNDDLVERAETCIAMPTQIPHRPPTVPCARLTCAHTLEGTGGPTPWVWTSTTRPTYLCLRGGGGGVVGVLGPAESVPLEER